jgi:hypothetical protein
MEPAPVDDPAAAPDPAALGEPIPVIALEYADRAADHAERRRRVWSLVGRLCAAGAWAWALAAWAIVAWGPVKYVLFTGPVLLAIGLATVLAGVLARRMLLLLLGAAHVLLCVLFVVLVNVNRWSPVTARRPFTLMGGAYLLAAAVPTVVATRRESDNDPH